MDPIEALTKLLNALAEASPTVIAIVEALVFGYGFYKGWWVPGWVHQREVQRGDEAVDAVEESTKTTKQAADATKTATDAALLLLRQFSDVQRLSGKIRQDNE